MSPSRPSPKGSSPPTTRRSPAAGGDLRRRQAAGAAKSTAEMRKVLASDDPVEQAAGRTRSGSSMERADATGSRGRSAGPVPRRSNRAGEQSQLLSSPPSASSWPFAARRAGRAGGGRRNPSMNNVKQIMLALLNYEAAQETSPPTPSTAPDGKPLLSWRVQFCRLWNNRRCTRSSTSTSRGTASTTRQLIARMPEILPRPQLKAGCPPTARRTTWASRAKDIVRRHAATDAVAQHPRRHVEHDRRRAGGRLKAVSVDPARGLGTRRQ